MTTLWLAAHVVFLLGRAAAQANDPSLEADILALHDEALGAYHEFRLDDARRGLEHALRLARLSGEREPHLRAQLHVTLAIVCFAQDPSSDEGAELFVRALCDDAAVEIDPLLATPDIAARFAQARERAKSACTPRPGGTPPHASAKVPRDTEVPPVLRHGEERKPTEPSTSRSRIVPLVSVGAAFTVAWAYDGMAADRTSPEDASGERLHVRRDGLVPGAALRAAVGAFVGERIALMAIARVQPAAGRGTLAGTLLGARIEWLALGQRDSELAWGVYAGASGGRIDVHPQRSEAWGISGLAGAHVGANLRVGIARHVTLLVSPELDVQLPTQLWSADSTLGLELRWP